MNSGLDVLELLARIRREATLTEIADLLRMSKSGVHGLLRTLVERGFVERAADGNYLLALKTWELGCSVPRIDLSRIASPYMSALVREISEGAILGTMDGWDVVYIQLVESPQPVRVHANLGDRIPAHCTSTGLALLAALSDEEVRERMPAQLDPITSETITQEDRLLRELQRVRVRGYAVNRGGWRFDVGGVAARVPCGDGEPVAALCVAAPRYRMTKAWRDRVCPALLGTARKIGLAVGGTHDRRGALLQEARSEGGA